MEYTVRETSDPGISFYLPRGRITIFKTTLAALGYPDNFRFLLDNDKRQLAIEGCSFGAVGSHQLKKIPEGHSLDIISKDMVQFIYQTCDWESDSTYRIMGITMPNRKMVVFDLNSAQKLS